MSLKRCSGCEAMVEASKAYCPDCGSPMDEEEKRSGFSEYDAFVKTQNINSTTQFKLLEQFNLSSFFKPPPKDALETDEVESNKTSAEVKEPQKTHTDQNHSDKAQTSLENKEAQATKNSQISDGVSTSDKKIYVILAGVILLVFSLVLMVFIISFLLWSNFR